MQPDRRLNGRPNRQYLSGGEANTGPIGHGLPTDTAIAGQVDGADFRTFVLTGDGEMQGSNREAAMTAGQRGLRNLTVIIDRTRL